MSEISRYLGAFVVVCLISQDGAWASRASYQGVAEDLESGSALYRERHEFEASPEGDLFITAYEDMEGNVFAHREVRFAARPFAPSYRLVDERVDYEEGVQWEGGTALVYKREGGERSEETVIPERHPLVIDAGFDRLVVEHWDDLIAGEAVRFDFLSADRLESIAFRLQLEGREASKDGPITTFSMTLANGFLRWLVEPIYIVYRNSDRSMYEYRGISNIRRPGGKGNYMVRIRYPRTERGESAAP